MKKTYYHATSYSNLSSIISEGLKVGTDHIIYLCERATDSLKFAYVHGVKNCLVCEVKLDEKDVKETFDHSQEFFKCKCFGYDKTISSLDIKFWRYSL